MTDYKYRVFDGRTGFEFADVANLSVALTILDAIRATEAWPQVTIDEIVPELDSAKAPVGELKVGDRVRGVGFSISGYEPEEGILEYIEPLNERSKYPYMVRRDDNEDPRWYSSVEPV